MFFNFRYTDIAMSKAYAKFLATILSTGQAGYLLKNLQEEHLKSKKTAFNQEISKPLIANWARYKTVLKKGYNNFHPDKLGRIDTNAFTNYRDLVKYCETVIEATEGLANDFATLVVGYLEELDFALFSSDEPAPAPMLLQQQASDALMLVSTDAMVVAGNESGDVEANDEKEVCSYAIVLYDKSIEYTAGEKTGNVLDKKSATKKRKGNRLTGAKKKKKRKKRKHSSNDSNSNDSNTELSQSGGPSSAPSAAMSVTTDALNPPEYLEGINDEYGPPDKKKKPPTFEKYIETLQLVVDKCLRPVFGTEVYPFQFRVGPKTMIETLPGSGPRKFHRYKRSKMWRRFKAQAGFTVEEAYNNMYVKNSKFCYWIVCVEKPFHREKNDFGVTNRFDKPSKNGQKPEPTSCTNANGGLRLVNH